MTPDTPQYVLSQSGMAQDGTPIVSHAPEADRYVKVLTSGFSGRLLRLYALAQRFSHPERPLQPAYLVLSDTQGGFPRWGFQRDGVKYPEAAYVDLPPRQTADRSTGGHRADLPAQAFAHHRARCTGGRDAAGRRQPGPCHWREDRPGRGVQQRGSPNTRKSWRSTIPTRPPIRACWRRASRASAPLIRTWQRTVGRSKPDGS